MVDFTSHPTEECANCGDALRLNVQYPVVTRQEESDFYYYSFCDDTCKADWESRSIRVAFTDINGQRGIVTEQLDISYSGEWEATVRAWTAERRTDWLADESDDADEHSPRLVLNHVMLELPDVVPVLTIEREDSPEVEVGEP